MAIGGRLGQSTCDCCQDTDPTVSLFAEITGRFVCEVDAADVDWLAEPTRTSRWWCWASSPTSRSSTCLARARHARRRSSPRSEQGAREPPHRAGAQRARHQPRSRRRLRPRPGRRRADDHLAARAGRATAAARRCADAGGRRRLQPRRRAGRRTHVRGVAARIASATGCAPSSPPASRSSASATASRRSSAPGCCRARSATTPAAASSASGSRCRPQPSRCIWTTGIDAFDCPIAHGEGRYVHPDVDALERAGQVALRYAREPQRQHRVDRRRVRPQRRGARSDATSREPRRRPPAPAAHPRPPRRARPAAVRAGRRPRQGADDGMARPLPRRRPADLPDRRAGKVRVSYRLSDTPAAVRHHRSAVGLRPHHRGVPYKGQVLNQLSRVVVRADTADIVANHVVDRCPTPTCTVGRTAAAAARRGGRARLHHRRHLTSLWQQYADGARTIYGYHLPDGLRKNTDLPAAIITPTTKAEHGAHDEPFSPSDVVAQGPGRCRRCGARSATLRWSCSPSASRSRREAGLILADTKYEFGLAADRRAAADRRDAHARLVALLGRRHVRGAAGRRRRAREPRQGSRPPRADRRRATAATAHRRAAGRRVSDATSARYIAAYERLTGLTFQPGSYPRRTTGSAEVLGHAA